MRTIAKMLIAINLGISLLVSTSAIEPEHGFAIIERFRNNTKYPVKITTTKIFHDNLPAKSIIRIKSYKAKYGKEGHYYAVRRAKGGFFLNADTTNANDPATKLIVHRHVDSNLEDWVGFSSLFANQQMLRAASTQAVQLSGVDFAYDSQSNAHWKIHGNMLEQCYIQNRATKGFLSPREEYDTRETTPEFTLEEIAKILPSISQDLSKAIREQKTILVEKIRTLSLKENLKKITKQFGANTPKANEKRDEEIKKNKARRFSEKRQVCYGDQIKLVHNDTLQRLYGLNSRFTHEGSSENYMTFCAVDRSEDMKDSWWIIKGPHNDNDSLNCAIGNPVKNGANIRLEHVSTKKNLHCDKYPPPPLKLEDEEDITPEEKLEIDAKQSKFKYEVSLFGQNGIGNSLDNWTIIFHEPNEYLTAGQLFALGHVATGYNLFSNNIFFTSSPDSTETVDENSIWVVELTIGRDDPKKAVRQRDQVRFRHMTTGKYLYSGQTTVTNDEKKHVVSAASKETANEEIMWRIKGPHKDGERWNCRNAQIQNGDIIRLESTYNGGNLANNGNPVEAGNGVYSIFTRQIQGKGIGDESDNWEVKVIGSSKKLINGTRIALRHVMSKTQGNTVELHSSAETLLQMEGQISPPQKVLLKKYIVKELSKTSENVKTYQRLSAFQKENPETKAMRKQIEDMEETSEKEFAEKRKKLAEAANQLTGIAKQTALADVEKMQKPEIPQKKKLEDKINENDKKLIWFIDTFKKARTETINVAWTGVPYGSPADQGPDEVVGIEVVQLGYSGGILPGRTVDRKIPLSTKPPTFSGFATEKVRNFDESLLLKLQPLLSNGVAWLEKPLKTPGEASVSFLARAGDKGDIQVVFGNELSLDHTWKVIIGANYNSEAQIIRHTPSKTTIKDEIVASVHRRQNPLAAAIPGRLLPYWVSISNGEILVGSGHVIGNDIIIAWRDPHPRNAPSRVGFGTHKGMVEYAGIQIGSSVSLQHSSRIHTTIKNDQITKSTPLWLAQMLRIPGRGTVSFDVKGSPNARLIIADDTKPDSARYAVTFTKNLQNKKWTGQVSLEKWNATKKQYDKVAQTPTSNNEKYALKEQGWKRFWISSMGGRFFMGMGEIGQNMFLYHWDLNPSDEFKHIGLQSPSGTAQFRNIQISPSVKVALRPEIETYEKGLASRYLYKGNLHIILPYEYHLSQEGPVVKFVDRINDLTFYPGKTPQQGAEYYFMLEIAKDGFPLLTWSRQPENLRLIPRRKAAHISRASGEALILASGYAEGAGEIGGVIGALASAAFAEAGVMVAKESLKEETALHYDYRKHTSYAFMDEQNYTKKGQSAVPIQAKTNRVKAEKMIELGGKWKPSSQKQLERLIPHYLQTILLITHPYVVRSHFIKQSISESLATLYEAHKELHMPPKDYFDLSYIHLMNLMLTAYNNPYLTDVYDASGAHLRSTWFGWANELARQIMLKSPNSKLTIQPNFGEYLWLNEQFKTPGHGAVSFEAQGTNDIMVCLSPMPVKIRNTANDVYEVAIGCNDNTKTVIRAFSLDKPIVETTKRKALASSLINQKYWISLNNGRVVVGKNDISEQNKILEWKDPYPTPEVSYIGIASWNAPVTFKNLQLQEPLETVTTQIEQKLAQSQPNQSL